MYLHLMKNSGSLFFIFYCHELISSDIFPQNKKYLFFQSAVFIVFILHRTGYPPVVKFSYIGARYFAKLGHQFGRIGAANAVSLFLFTHT